MKYHYLLRVTIKGFFNIIIFINHEKIEVERFKINSEDKKLFNLLDSKQMNVRKKLNSGLRGCE